MQNNENTRYVVKRKRKFKKGVFQTCFCLISLAFLIGCGVFYGSRLIKYYKIYNPKSSSGGAGELISNAIVKNTEIVYEGDGLYRTSGMYVYKGTDVNNYIRFSNMMWRIVKTNLDGSIEMVLDDYINILKWDFETYDYVSSDVNKYINDVFLSKLNKDMLNKVSVCTDKIDDLNQISCANTNTDYYVKLISLSDFINSKNTSTYISNENDYVWFSTSGSEQVWHSNGNSVSVSPNNASYQVKPVVTLKNYTQILSGTGTEEDPYMVEKETSKIALGSYVKINDDLWIAYETTNNQVKLISASLYNDGSTTYRFDPESNKFDPESSNSLAKYLNTTYYNSLDYKDIIVDGKWYIGGYSKSYKDVYSDSVTAKVGTYNIVDIKLNNEIMGYNLLTPSDEDKIYYYNENIISSKITLSRSIRPAITIKTQKIEKGNGTKSNPFVIEV